MRERYVNWFSLFPKYTYYTLNNLYLFAGNMHEDICTKVFTRSFFQIKLRAHFSKSKVKDESTIRTKPISIESYFVASPYKGNNEQLQREGGGRKLHDHRWKLETEHSTILCKYTVLPFHEDWRKPVASVVERKVSCPFCLSEEGKNTLVRLSVPTDDRISREVSSYSSLPSFQTWNFPFF